MGLFSKKQKCSICGNTNSNGSKGLIENGFLCDECIKKCVTYLSVSSKPGNFGVDEIKKMIQLNRINTERIRDFQVTNKIADIFFDDKHRWFKVGGTKKVSHFVADPIVHEYEEILNFELLEDGESVIRGGLSSAIAGGLLFGETGAVIGGMTGSKKINSIVGSLKVKITLKNIENPIIYIELLHVKADKSSAIYASVYQLAQKIISVLSIIVEETKVSLAQNIVAETSSVAGELREYKSLLDDGILSEDEFNAKKKQLLGL